MLAIVTLYHISNVMKSHPYRARARLWAGYGVKVYAVALRDMQRKALSARLLIHELTERKRERERE